MNDSLRTDVFVRYSPETIACACIYLTARQLEVRPSEHAAFESLCNVCCCVLTIFHRSQ